MRPVEFYGSYGMMRHEELVREASNYYVMRVLREERGPRIVAFLSRLLSRAGRAVAEPGRRMEAAGRVMNGKPAHG